MALSLRICYILFIVFFSAFAYCASGVDSLKYRLGTVEKTKKPTVYLKLAKEYMLTNVDSSAKYAELAIVMADQNGMIEEEAEACLLLGKIYVQQDSYRDAMNNSQKALQLFRSLNDRLGTANALCDIGISHYLFGDYDQALDFYLQALQIQEEMEDMNGMVRTLNNISLIYIELENFDKAMEYSFKCLEIAERSGNKETVMKILINIGANYTSKKDFDRSNEYYRRALEYIKTENIQTTGYYAILNNIGENYMSLDHPVKALEYFTESIEKIKEIGLEKGIAYALVSISKGEAYIKLKDFEKAQEYLQQGLNLAKEINSKKFVRMACFHLSLMYKEKGDFKMSLEYYRQYSEVKDSILNLETSNKIAELQTRYETEKKEKEIDMLNIEKQLNDTKLNARTNWLIIFISGFVIILIFSIVFYIQKIIQKRTNKILVQKNLEIVESERRLIESKNEQQQYKDVVPGQETITDQKPKEDKQEKYSESPLDEQQKQRIKRDILQAIEKEKIYLESDMSINKLAQHLNISRTYISQVINEKFSRNFTNFINEYRIREARRLLSDVKSRKYTIESIAQSVGFNSRPSFNNAFKKYTGITPSFYIRSIHDNQ